jgi:hypothetical protein
LANVTQFHWGHRSRPQRWRHCDSSRRGPLVCGDEMERLQSTAAGHRADFERERDRADRLMAALLRASTFTMAAKEAAARLEGELDALRFAALVAPAGQLMRATRFCPVRPARRPILWQLGRLSPPLKTEPLSRGAIVTRVACAYQGID